MTGRGSPRSKKNVFDVLTAVQKISCTKTESSAFSRSDSVLNYSRLVYVGGGGRGGVRITMTAGNRYDVRKSRYSCSRATRTATNLANFNFDQISRPPRRINEEVAN